MKRLFRKDNRIARIVALLLVLIMALTPLYEHSGFKVPTKAANLPTEISFSVPFDLSKLEIVKGDTQYKINSIAVPTDGNIPRIHAYYDGDTAPTYYLSTNAQGGVKYVAEVDGTTTNYSMTNGCKVVGTVVTLDSLGDGISDTEPTPATSVAPGQYYAIYVSIADGCDDGNGVAIDATETSDNWTLQAIYKLEKDDSLTNNWRAVDGTALTEGGTYSDAYIGVAQKEGDLYIGNVEYYYAIFDGKFGNAASTNNYASTMLPVSQGKFEKNAGKYAVWAKYDPESDGSADWYSMWGNIITVDSVAPSLSGTPYVKEDGTTVFWDNDTNKLFYLNSESTHNLEFVVADNVPNNIDSDIKFPVKAISEDRTEEIVLPDAVVKNPSFGGTYIVASLAASLKQNVTYIITAEVKDNLGNTSTIDLGKVRVINKEFTATPTYFVVENGVETPASITDFNGITGLISNKPYKIYVKISSGNPLKQAVIKCGKNGVDPITEDLSNVTAVGGLYEKTISYAFDQTGNYYWPTITVYEESGASKEVAPGHFTYETETPTIEWTGIYRQNGTEWENVTSEVDIATNAFSIDKTDETYKLEFKANDNKNDNCDSAAGLDYGLLLSGDTLVGTDGKLIADEDNEGIYYIILDKSTIVSYMTDDSVTFKAQMYDKAGNKAETNAVTLIKSVEGIFISSAVLTTGDGKPVDIENPDKTDNRISDSGYKLDLVVTSDYKIKDVVIGEANSSDIYDIDISVTEDNTFNDISNRYTYKATVTIPKNIEVNTLLDDAIVTVTDECTPVAQEASKNLGKLLHDSSNPTIKNTRDDAVDGEFVVNDPLWYPNYTVSAQIKPGPQTVETGLVSASYTFANTSNAVDEKTVAENITTPVSEVDMSFDVPESKDASGTVVTFNASDEAGNYLQDDNVIKVKVDATAPIVENIQINGADAKTTNYGPVINISTLVKDNLSLDSVIITVQKEQEDGTYIDVESGQTYNIGSEGVTSHTFNYPSTLTLADGKYKVTVVAKDKAQRSSADDTDVANEEVYFTVKGALSVEGMVYTIESVDDNGNETLTNGRETFDVEATDGTKTPTVSNKKHKLVLQASSGYNFDSCQILSGTEVVATPSFTNVENIDGFYYATVEYIFGDDGSRSYNDLTVIVKDKNNTDATASTITKSIGSFLYDETAPNMEFEGLYKSTDGGLTWQKIEREHLDQHKNTYTINSTSLSDLYRFVYDIEEKGSGVDTAVLLCDGTPIIKNEGDKMSSESTNVEYYAELDASQILEDIEAYGTDNKLSYEAQVTDKATNKSDKESPKFKVEKPDNKFDLQATMYKLDESGNRIPVDLNGEDYYTNSGYILEVTTSSLFPIDTIDLEYGEGRILSSVPITPEENQAGYDQHSTRFTIKVDIDVPQNSEINQILENMKLVVKNALDEEVEKNVGSLLYDSTLPRLVNNKREDGALVDDQTWYTEYKFDAVITPGPQGENTVESFIGYADYTISGSVSGDVNNQALTIDENGKVSISFAVPESKTLEGTTIDFAANDMAGNYLAGNNKAVIRVDSTKPKLESVSVYDDNSFQNIVGENVTIDIKATDNLAVDNVVVEVKQLTGGTTSFTRPFDHSSENATETNDKYNLTLTDGTYQATVTVYDKTKTLCDTKTVNFEVDKTNPAVTAKILSGTMGGKKPSKNFDGTDRDYYYSSDVVVEFTYKEKNLDNIVVKDNNSVVSSVKWERVGNTDEYVGKYTVKSEGLHNINIQAFDKTGHSSDVKTISFVRDTKAPTLSTLINGAINYSESDGVRVFTADTSVAFSEVDDNKDPNGFFYQMTKSVPDETPVVGKVNTTTSRSFSYTDEAEYTVKVYSVDMASNTSETRTVQFRIDKTAPDISIGGIGDGGTSANPVTVSLNMQELYWRDATGTVNIYFKSGEGFGEELVEEIAYTPTGRSSAISRTFSESGIYRIEFNAQDSAGHTATAGSSFTIDTEAPVVTLEGVSNYDVTDESVTISSTITDKFYASKRVTISGTVTDETGKVTPLNIDNYSATANPTTINETFTEDGIYDLTITCVDVAGNTDTKTVHFTIDKSDPVIGDLSAYDDKILTSFEWDEDLDELVSDLTVCDVRMYLNGQEYNGEDAVEDGSYVLLITAEDELGHKVEKSVEFVLDTKAPVFIVTGVEDEEKRLEPYNISVSVQLEEDTLTSVTLNDKVITITNNVATFDVTEIGEYKLYMEAVDEAGNVSSAEYEFKLMSEKEFNIWIALAILAILSIIIIIIILKRKKDKE